MSAESRKFDPRLAKPRTQRGSALLLVLAAVALLSLLVIAFLVRTGSETRASASAAESIKARILADSAVHLVIGQIREGASTTAETSWISQPGAIRTFRGNREPEKVFKLYSSANMTVDAAGFDPSDAEPFLSDGSWKDGGGKITPRFTDLNQPIRIRSELRYPIVNPGGTTAANGGDGQVAGFEIKNSEFVVHNEGAISELKMPLEWLYQLQDGSLVAMGADGKVPLASKENPIIGRLAFWTDDETSKINVNTAAGDIWTTPNTAEPGAFWATPRLPSAFDINSLALSQPVRGEFQRYPGHPATTYLAAAFSNLNLTRAQLTALAPKIYQGGSAGGSTRTVFPTATPPPIIPDPDRLYSSVDEFLYAPDRSVQSPLTTKSLEQARFFLTAHSRAPELNLWNQPRVSIWPITLDYGSGARRMTPFDRLIAFCSSVGAGQPGEKSYFFSRQRSDSQTFDYENIQRNRELYAYLSSFMQRELPGVGGRFSAKYPQDHLQILTQMVDYIRCVNLGDTTTGATRYTPGFEAAGRLAPGSGQVLPLRIGATQGFGRMPALSEAALLFWVSDADSTDETRQKMRAMLLFEMFCPAVGTVSLRENYDIRVSNLTPVTVSQDAAPNLISLPPTQTLNWPGTSLTLSVQFGSRFWWGRPNGGWMGLGGQTQLDANSGRNVSDGVTVASGDYPFVTREVDIKQVSAAASGENALKMNFGANPPGMNISSLSFQVEILPAGETDPSKAVQVYQISFPGGKFPLPRINPGWRANATVWDYWRTMGLRFAKNRIVDNAAVSGSNPKIDQAFNFINDVGFEGFDITRSLVPAGPSRGDLRLTAVRASVASGEFVPHAKYHTTTTRHANSLQTAVGQTYRGAEIGSLVVTTEDFPPTGGFGRPDFPSNLTGGALNVFGAPGDFDTSPGNLPDGPFINKADEGDASITLTSSGTLPPYFFRSFGLDSDPKNPVGDTLFSPNRQISSAVLFGSLPTGVFANEPWQTLLFTPWPAALSSSSHRGFTVPADHYLLDLFQMPVVEPYAISEPFSTAGKVNMNYQIVPFHYIERTTALQATLKPVMVTGIENSDKQNAVWGSPAGVVQGYRGATPFSPPNPIRRYPLDLDETLKGFLDGGRPKTFLSASEICEVGLVPAGEATQATLSSFWQNHRLTGDNLREEPYAALYPRLTTRSNTFTVYVKAQALAKVPVSAGDTWDDGRDRVLAEFQGSFSVERYIDPNDPVLTREMNSDTDSLTPAYKFRVLSAKQFSP